MRSRGWNLVFRIGGGVVGTAGVVTLPGISDVLGDFGNDLLDNPLSAVAVAIGVALLALGFRDSILGYLGFRTPRAIDRRVRDWLHWQKYTVTPVQGPSNFVYAVAAGEDDLHFTVVLLEDPRRVEVRWGGKIADGAHADAMRDASPAVMRQVVSSLQHLAAAVPAVSVIHWENRNDPANFRVVFGSNILVESLTPVTFFDAIHAVRKCGLAILTILTDAAESLIEQTGAHVPPRPDDVIAAADDAPGVTQ